MKTYLAVILATAMLVACSSNPQAPTPTNPSAPATGPSGTGHTTTLSELVGVWIGHETASKGESGDLTVVFENHPTPGKNVRAQITWTSDTTHKTYEGQVEGTLEHLTINSHPAYDCVYKAEGALNAAGNQITGTYFAVGAAPCPSKAGTFYLNRQQ